MPLCPDCGVFKDKSEFFRDVSRTAGRTRYCKPCHRQRQRLSYQRHRPSRILAMREDDINARARLHKAEGTFNLEEFFWLCNMLEWHCEYCDIELSPQTAYPDHIVPLSRGGSNLLTNIAVSCNPCNASKLNRLLSEWAGRSSK